MLLPFKSKLYVGSRKVLDLSIFTLRPYLGVAQIALFALLVCVHTSPTLSILATTSLDASFIKTKK